MNCINSYCTPLKQNVLVEQSLDLKMRASKAKYYLKWGSFNVIILAILMFDISNKCPYAESNWYYLEYGVATIVGLSMLACFLKYFLYIFYTQPVQGTRQQKNLMKFDDNDNSFITTTPKKKEQFNNKRQESYINNTILSWHSSFNESRGANSPNWSYTRTTPPRQSLSPQQQHQLQNASWNSSMMNNSNFNASTIEDSSSPFVSPYQKYERDEQITDHVSLQRYLKDVSRKEYSMTEITDINPTFSTGGSINSFWSYCNNAANLLKTSLYQLSPSPAPATQNKQTSKEEGGLNIIDSNSEVIKRISSERLAQYVGNLRTWISFTILQRLTKEIGNIDESFKQRGFHDMQIGGIGLERLKKTVESQQFVTLYMPMLPMIVPFLEMSSNQEYLVQRIKDLAKGSCIADYRWNSGSEYHGLKWDEHLPTDSAILFHLFCVYLDTQLMPLPQGGGRPFYSRYVIIGEEKRSAKDTVALVQNKAHCAILCTNPLKPKFNFISDGEIHNCAYDRNNLFYVIIQFLIYMRSHQESSLEGVNLGKSGINIMCVIED
ncbi:transmembrane protein 209 isoform X1 [Lucilia cuprina]|uniref:transmembrane protein 209 isoform X1 n=2 Tax=Lucilia cuprina TaxID=7375 RepID=UPI001F05DF38|nr:transmembrane protein 209 isoform X1 [Lucilia cuprina]